MRCWFQILIVLGWLVHHTSAGIGRFDPKNYRSPSGEFTLSVEPSDRFGRGATRYALIRDGVRLWARDHPFALQDAAVTDEGWVVGWAQTKDESVTPSVNLYLHFVLDEAGEVARRDQWSLAQPRVDFGGRVRFSIDAHGAFALEDRRGVLVVRGANPAALLGSSTDLWWHVYRMGVTPTVEFLSLPSPPRMCASSRPSLIEIERVPGEALVLTTWIEWCQTAGLTRRFLTFAAYSDSAELVWSQMHPEPCSIAIGDNTCTDYSSYGLRRISAEHGSFTTTSWIENWTRRYEVRQSRVDPARREIVEVGLDAFHPPRTVSTPIEILEPIERGSITLRGKERDLDPNDVLSMDIGPEGSFCAISLDGETVSWFDPSGDLRATAAGPGNAGKTKLPRLKGMSPEAWISIKWISESSALVEPRSLGESPRVWICSPGLEPRVVEGLPAHGSRNVAPCIDGSLWIMTYEGTLMRVSPDAFPLAISDRRFDGRWIEPFSMLVAPDCSALVAQTDGWALFAPDGRATGILQGRSAVEHAVRSAFDGEWIISARGASVTVSDLTCRSWHMNIPNGGRYWDWDVLIVPGSKEFLLRRTDGLVLRRYALPTKESR